MKLVDSVANAIANRSLQLVGLLFGSGSVAHFTFWARGPDRAFDTAVATGDVGAAIPEVLAYAQSHPAYLLAFVVGAALLVQRP